MSTSPVGGGRFSSCSIPPPNPNTTQSSSGSPPSSHNIRESSVFFPKMRSRLLYVLLLASAILCAFSTTPFLSESIKRQIIGNARHWRRAAVTRSNPHIEGRQPSWWPLKSMSPESMKEKSRMKYISYIRTPSGEWARMSVRINCSFYLFLSSLLLLLSSFSSDPIWPLDQCNGGHSLTRCLPPLPPSKGP